MKKEERLQQQCDVCGRLLDKNISNFRKYSRKTNGLNFHTTCRDCEDRIKLNTEWKDGKLLCHICGEYKEPSEFTYAGANKYTLRQNKECRCNSCKLEQRKAAIATYDNDVKLEKVLQARWLAAKSRAIDNIQLVCMAVNQLKSDLDMDTILILCSAIVDNAAKWKH